MSDSLQFHPVANIFPLMEGRPFEDLCDSIQQNGLMEGIWIYKGQIIDGRNRYRACRETGVEARFRAYEGEEADLVGFVVALNLHRRHLSESQRAMVAANIAKLERGANQHSQICPPSQASAASMLNVSVGSVKSAKAVQTHGTPELVKAVEKGDVAVSTAAVIATAPKEEQRQILARTDAEILAAAKAIRQEKAQVNAAARAVVKAEAAKLALPAGKYRTIVIDPPWQMQKIERDERPDQVGFEYPTMTEAELMAFDLPAFAHDDCHLYLWTTHKHLPLAMRLAEHWGFRYQCLMTWVKNVGFTPFSWMYSTEHVLFCRKGSLDLLKMGKRLDFSAAVREHSRKPDEFYSLVAEVSPGPRVDIFGREPREGFDVWGAEGGKFEVAG